jgi:hypothetical protein
MRTELRPRILTTLFTLSADDFSESTRSIFVPLLPF